MIFKILPASRVFLETAFCRKTNSAFSSILNTQKYRFKERDAGILKTLKFPDRKSAHWLNFCSAPSHVLKKRPAKVSFAAAE